MKNFELRPLPTPKKVQSSEPALAETKTDASQATTVRLFVDVSIEIADKLKDYAYWERLTQQETMLDAIQEFLKGKSIKSRPESVKNRKPVGRRRKNL